MEHENILIVFNTFMALIALQFSDFKNCISDGYIYACMYLSKCTYSTSLGEIKVSCMQVVLQCGLVNNTYEN